MHHLTPALFLLALAVGCDNNNQNTQPGVPEDATIQIDEYTSIEEHTMYFGVSQAQAVQIVNDPKYPWGQNDMMIWWPDNDGDGFGAVSDDLTYAAYEDMGNGQRLAWANNCLDSDDTNANVHPDDPFDGSYYLSCGLSPMLCMLGTLELEVLEVHEFDGTE